MFPKASDKTFLDKLQTNHSGKNPAYGKVNKNRKGGKDAHFELGHYAGAVSIICTDILETLDHMVFANRLAYNCFDRFKNANSIN